jgi:hypothetical protein
MPGVTRDSCAAVGGSAGDVTGDVTSLRDLPAAWSFGVERTTELRAGLRAYVA